jgi:hypothetical protein
VAVVVLVHPAWFGGWCWNKRLPRTYIRCRGFPHPGFDRYAQTASQDPRWRLCQLAGNHLPYITNPHQLASILLELAS